MADRINGFRLTTLSPGVEGIQPKPGDHLVMHYTGRLRSNGKEFDSSLDRDKPFEFQIGKGQVIRGWDEGILEMKLGEKANLEISSAYGYGARGAGKAIPPHSELVFEVELLAINGRYSRDSNGRTRCSGCQEEEEHEKQFKGCGSCKTVSYCGRYVLQEN